VPCICFANLDPAWKALLPVEFLTLGDPGDKAERRISPEKYREKMRDGD